MSRLPGGKFAISGEISIHPSVDWNEVSLSSDSVSSVCHAQNGNPYAATRLTVFAYLLYGEKVPWSATAFVAFHAWNSTCHWHPLQAAIFNISWIIRIAGMPDHKYETTWFNW